MKTKSVLFLFFCLPTLAQALVIDFEDVPHEPVNAVGDLVSGGFLFDLATDHYHVLDHTYLGGPANGTTWFAVDDNNGNNPVTMSVTGGGVFSLSSLDLAEWFSEPSTEILVIGNFSGGGSVSTSLIMDQVWDGVGGVADFETFVFNSSWTNLSSVVFDSTGAGNGPHQGWAIDNIDVSAHPIPGPSTISVLSAGLLSLLASRRIVGVP